MQVKTRIKAGRFFDQPPVPGSGASALAWRRRIGRIYLPVAYPRSDLASLRRLSPQRFRITGRLMPVYHTSPHGLCKDGSPPSLASSCDEGNGARGAKGVVLSRGANNFSHGMP